MGVSPDVFGPFLWGSLHYVCLGSSTHPISPENQTHLKNWINALPFVIPCYKCSEHLKQNLSDFPVDSHLSSHEELFKWSVDFHNIVNKQLGKPEISLEEAKELWQPEKRHPCPSNILTPQNTASANNSKNYIIFALVFIIIALITTLLFNVSNVSLSKTTKKR